jgi:hypothetical protein
VMSIIVAQKNKNTINNQRHIIPRRHAAKKFQ